MASKGNTWYKQKLELQKRYDENRKGISDRFADDGYDLEAAPRKINGFCNRGMFHGSAVSPLRGK
jgi:hypothetical protein